jgi:hypothetical protein|tara:strand:- start:3424 stop:3828 length:405 start_codon:yes stop_codon:yes gene_type:complete
MGYRSNVVIAIQKEAYDEEMLLGVGRDDAFHNAAHYLDNAYYWVFNHTKWSEFYPQVTYIESIFDSLDKQYADAPSFLSGHAYGFLRVGEDSNDIDERGDPGAYEIYPHTQIEYPEKMIKNTPTIGEQNATAAA